MVTAPWVLAHSLVVAEPGSLTLPGPRVDVTARTAGTACDQCGAHTGSGGPRLLRAVPGLSRGGLRAPRAGSSAAVLL